MARGAVAEVRRVDQRPQLYAPFQELRGDIRWNQVAQIPDMNDGKVIVVTGGSKGLGKDIVWWTAVFGGAKVVFCDVDREAGHATAKEFTKQIKRSHGNGEVTFRYLNVANPRSSKNFIDSVVQTHGKIDVLINNAGIGTVDTLATCTQQKFNEIVNVNLRGFVHLTQPFINYVAQGRTSGLIEPEERRKVITVCSIGGILGLAERFSYAVSKRALAGAIASTAIDHGKIVEVIGINPGRMKTDMAAGRIAEAPEAQRELVQYMMWGTQRNGAPVLPEEVGAFVNYASSDDPGTLPLRNTQIRMDDAWELGYQLDLRQMPLPIARALLAMLEAQEAEKIV